MSEQIALEGFDDTPRPTDRLFFALYPDAQTASGIGQLARQQIAAHGLRGPALLDDRFHITLHHLGDHAGLPPSLLREVHDTASRVVASPFDVRLDHAMSFAGRRGQPGRKHPFVLLGQDDGVAEVMAFQQKLGQALRQTSAGRWVEASFTPHVTLSYDAAVVADHPVPAVGWTVREFVLVHSLIGQTRHIVLGRWPLAAVAVTAP